jgi:hypothetical protein
VFQPEPDIHSITGKAESFAVNEPKTLREVRADFKLTVQN